MRLPIRLVVLLAPLILGACAHRSAPYGDEAPATPETLHEVRMAFERHCPLGSCLVESCQVRDPIAPHALRCRVARGDVPRGDFERLRAAAVDDLEGRDLYVEVEAHAGADPTESVLHGLGPAIGVGIAAALLVP
jgi:hypothetical protein